MTNLNAENTDSSRVIHRVPIFADLPPLPDFTGAACAQHPFLPPTTWDLIIPGESITERQIRRQIAAEVCAVCPLRDLCESIAHDEQAPSGVWAGKLFNPNTGTESDIPVQSYDDPVNEFHYPLRT